MGRSGWRRSTSPTCRGPLRPTGARSSRASKPSGLWRSDDRQGIEDVSGAGLQRLHEAMAARVAKAELPGMVILLAHGDDVQVDPIGAMAFGSEVPMRRDAIFRIASLTKPILATATMMLVEDGTLALAEPVDRLLPELADRKVLRRIDGPLDDTVPARRPITVEDLLTFRMGYGLVFEP